MINAGTFGQESTWDLGMPTSYQHPIKTKDLLFHTATSFTGTPASQDDEQPPREADDEDASMPQTPSRKTPFVKVHSELSVTEMEEEVWYITDYKWCEHDAFIHYI